MHRRTVLRGIAVLLGGMGAVLIGWTGTVLFGGDDPLDIGDRNVDLSVSKLRVTATGESRLTLALFLSVNNSSDAELIDPSVETTLSYNSSDLTTVEKSLAPIPAGERVTRSIDITLVYEEMTQIALDSIRNANALVDVEGTFRSDQATATFEETVSVTEG